MSRKKGFRAVSNQFDIGNINFFLFEQLRTSRLFAGYSEVLMGPNKPNYLERQKGGKMLTRNLGVEHIIYIEQRAAKMLFHACNLSIPNEFQSEARGFFSMVSNESPENFKVVKVGNELKMRIVGELNSAYHNMSDSEKKKYRGIFGKSNPYVNVNSINYGERSELGVDISVPIIDLPFGSREGLSGNLTNFVVDKIILPSQRATVKSVPLLLEDK
jgi:hypothetical protein